MYGIVFRLSCFPSHRPKIKHESCRSTSSSIDNPIYQDDGDSEEDCELPEELSRILQQELRVIQPHQEAVEIVNLGSEEEKKEVKIGATLNDEVERKLIELLREYMDVFAWSNQDMSGLDTDIVVNRLPLKEECSLVKQKLRRTRPDMAIKIKE